MIKMILINRCDDCPSRFYIKNDAYCNKTEERRLIVKEHVTCAHIQIPDWCPRPGLEDAAKYIKKD